LLGFIIAVIAGFLTPHAEQPLARPLARALGGAIRLEAGEMRLLSFMLMMLLAGLASALLSSGSAFWVMLGGALGYFATRLMEAARRGLGGPK